LIADVGENAMPSLEKQTIGARAGRSVRTGLHRAGRPTATELERRKARIMSVAAEMFISRGFAATSLLEIAKGSGVATRTLYQHFGDKTDIFREVIFARDTAVIDPPVAREGESLSDVLQRAAQYCFTVALRSRSIDLMRLMIAESARFPELMGKVAAAIFTRFTGNLARLFEQLAEAGLIPEANHLQTAEMFADLILGNRTVMIYFGWTSNVPTEVDIALKIELFINGRFRMPASLFQDTSLAERP
jgi:TetR/AcrR family transcriptional repressor of mexJK operon